MSTKRKTFSFIALIAIALFFLSEACFDLPILRRIIPSLSTKTENLAARVSGHPITRSQLERALAEQLWLEGKSVAGLAPADLKTARDAALQELIDHELLRLQVKAAAPPLLANDGEINERQQRLANRFESKAAFEAAMKPQGIPSERDLRARLAARICQEKFIERKIAPNISVTDEESRKWFLENQSSMTQPERVEARHIFIPTLDHPPEEAKKKLDEALVMLTEKKKDFATLAKEISEDPATKDSGGALGWMARDRLPADFSAPLFSLEPNKPTLVRSRLGWHLVEVTARKAGEPRSYEQAKAEILSALDAVKRRQAITDFRKALRKSEAVNIEIF